MLVIDLTSVFFFAAVFVSKVSSYGEYVPKSVYLLDEYGHKTNEFHVRNKRDLESALRIYKRSPGNGQSGGNAYSYSGSYSGNNGDSYIPPHFADFAANIPSSLHDIKTQAENFANLHGRSGNFPSEDDLGYKGPILFSRSGVDKGTGVRVSGAAQGPNGAFSSSSSSVDDRGNIRYNVKSGKY